MHDPKKLATYFRNLKEERNLTQVEMSQITGVAQSTISKLLNGQHVQARTVQQIAEAFEVNLESLYHFTGALPTIRTHDNHGNLTPEFIDQLILEGLHRLSPTNKAKVLRYINELDQ